MVGVTEILELAGQAGFTNAAPLEPSGLVFRSEVRDMCAADKCNKYDKCWSCPPGCGTLDEISARSKGYANGVLVQSTGQLEDDFDAETMMETAKLQRERFFDLTKQVRRLCPDCLPMASGACDVCPSCTYPGAPCRFPEKAIPSMEAYGLIVSDVCTGAGAPYYYGPKTITYTSCILF